MLLLYTGAEENSNISLENSSILGELTVNHSPEIAPPFLGEVDNLENNSIDEILSQNITDETISNDSPTEIINSSIQDSPLIQNAPLLQTESSSSGSSDSTSSSEDDVNYIDLSNVTQKDAPENSENFAAPDKTDYISLQIQGKKEMDIGDYTGSGINKSEYEKNEYEKEVIVSSEEHFEGYLRVYTSLTAEAKKEDIKIYWRNNENIEITSNNEFLVEYYDENNNGLIDRISWIVPHLSEQIFDIKIELSKDIESQEQILLHVIGPSAQTRNPINFKASVNYSGNFSCNLKIGGSINNETYNISSNYTYSLNLPNGNYTWEFACFNYTNGYLNSTFGSFEVKEDFNSSIEEGKLYFLDLVDNKIKNPETITINSTNSTNIFIKIIKNGQVIYTKSASNSTTIVMNEALLNSSGIYNLNIEFSEPSPKAIKIINFSVASVNLILNTTSIKEGESVKLNVIINSPIKKISTVYLEYGDGSSDFNATEINAFNKEFTKKYSQDGQYTINLSTTILGLGITYQIKKSLTVINSKDDSAPTINLEEPEDEAIIHESAVNFSYKANDNVKIQNCTFKLYTNCASMSYCSTNSANLLFPTNSQQNSIANNYSVQNNKRVEIKLEDFEDGIYEWLIECYDNSSNYNWEIGFFKIAANDTPLTSSSVSSKNYTQKKEVEDLKKQADIFLTKNFNLEEKEVLEDLSILNNTKYYKKRLTDIGDFLGENYKYVSTQELRDKKTEEYLTELENIKNRMPKNITIRENYEYIKNSVDSDLESIVEDYFSSTNTNIGKSSIQKLAKINRELQNEISVSAKIKNVEIEYGNETQIITFVKKEITLKNESYRKILEVIPKDIAKSSDDIIFLTSNKIINEDPLFEVDYENLDKKEIIYYTKLPVKIKDLEKTETLLFEDNLNKFNSGFTGFFVVDFVSGDSAIYFLLAFILLIVLAFVGAFVFKKFKMIGWRKEPNVVRVMDLIDDINKLLKEKEIEKAREKYYRIKEIYPVLPDKTKAYFYEKVNEVLIRIDRKDIFGLVKEYQEAKRNWNKEDYLRLYADIKKIYERLPEKDRKKVYDIINGY